MAPVLESLVLELSPFGDEFERQAAAGGLPSSELKRSKASLQTEKAA